MEVMEEACEKHSFSLLFLFPLSFFFFFFNILQHYKLPELILSDFLK